MALERLPSSTVCNSSGRPGVDRLTVDPLNILVIATLDTKAEEAGFICDQIRQLNHRPILLDPGMLGTAPLAADYTREAIALAAGHTLASLVETKDKAFIQNNMIEGLKNVVLHLHKANKVDGVISVGGGQGTAIATAAMQTLPIGIPKFMVSTVACGKTTFGPYVGTKDISILHSVSDISGLNPITTNLISQAVAAVIAMASVNRGQKTKAISNLVAITATGVTTPAVMKIKELLKKQGYEVIIFHGNGIGTEAMEEMILAGKVSGLIDVSPHDIVDRLFDGMMPAPEGRLESAGKMGIPQIILPGCADMLLKEWREDFPPELLNRKYVRHTPTHTHFRTTYVEMKAVGFYITQKLNLGNGKRCVIVPLKGYSMLNAPDKPLWDAKANSGFLDAVREEKNADVELITPNYHINDPELAEIVVNTYISMCK